MKSFFSDIFGYAVLECIIKNHTELQILDQTLMEDFQKHEWIFEFVSLRKLVTQVFSEIVFGEPVTLKTNTKDISYISQL